MPRHPFSPSFLAASVFCAATPALAALQPIAEAPLAGETEFRCQFNADNSTDCVSTYSFTILKPSGREMLSRIDRSYAETDSLIVEKAELTQPGGKPVPLDQSQIDTRTAPNPDQASCANARPPWRSPTCASAPASATPCASTSPPSR